VAATGKRNKRTDTTPTEARPRVGQRAPKEKVIEAGGEQGGERMAPPQAAPAGHAREAARKKEREEYRHGGIPIGSDPRE
jgi:hypothetical protein